VANLLTQKVWSEPAFATLREVRNGTGYRRTERYADLVVVSCWPSRGLWIGGVEIKVSRSDWTRELRDPEKSAEIQKWCKYWWVAAPIGVVRDGELPETWGLVEVTESTAKLKRAAPELKPAELDVGFVASLLRNQSRSVQAAIGRAVQDELQKFEAERGELDALNRRVTVAEKHAKDQLRRADAAELRMREFQEATGLTLNEWRQAREAKLVRIVQAMEDPRRLVVDLGRSIAQLHAALADAQEALKEPTPG